MHLTGLQIGAATLIVIASVIGVALFGRTVGQLARVIRLGQPDPTRGGQARARAYSLFAETLGHARLGRWPLVGIMHWFVFVGFGALFFTLVTAYGQIFDPRFALPLVGHWAAYEWATEIIAWLTLLGIVVLIAIRQRHHPKRSADEGRRSRFYGSSFWQAYYVELTILAVAICVLVLRGHEYALAKAGDGDHPSAIWHYPTTSWIGNLINGAGIHALENGIVIVATVKIFVSMAWFVTIALQPTMGVAWHRFLAFLNVWFKRHPGTSGDRRLTPSLGALQPIRLNGEVLDFEKLDDLDEDAALGVGKVEDFTWKGLLDFSTCTECGRCQSQCPAWNTDKPLSPKLLILSLRDHAHGKAPWLLAGGDEDGAAAQEAIRRAAKDGDTAAAAVVAQSERPLVGAATPGSRGAGGPGVQGTGGPSSTTSHAGVDVLAGLAGGVIDPDVLWSCTTCGACVEQCPVDIEHVDHIVDLRRYQVLIESAFPSELGGLFKNLEKNANPWGVSPRQRLEWAKGLPFEVPQVGQDVEDLTGVDYLFWVGCAGAFEDRQKKTTRAVAELLHLAGVGFAVLGDGESCTGDPARRSGNEFLFATLAMGNVEVLDEAKATKIVVTCAHCFNTLKNEYPQLGGHYEVVHHTQLLNRLVRDGRLTPVAPLAKGVSAVPSAAATADPLPANGSGTVTGSTVTYHDPCYIGRHNGVYTPPRELIEALPGVTLAEMPRHGNRSFCCGAGGARMWMEEKLGTRINTNRVEEALGTGADKIAVACPFCRVMLSDGLTGKQADGSVGDDIEVVDVAQLLLAAVRRADVS